MTDEARRLLERIEAAAGFGALEDVADHQRGLGLEGDREAVLREWRVKRICAALAPKLEADSVG